MTQTTNPTEIEVTVTVKINIADIRNMIEAGDFKITDEQAFLQYVTTNDKFKSDLAADVSQTYSENCTESDDMYSIVEGMFRDTASVRENEVDQDGEDE